MFWLQKLQHLQVSSSSSKVGVPRFWNFSILSVSPLALAQRVHRVLSLQCTESLVAKLFSLQYYKYSTVFSVHTLHIIFKRIKRFIQVS